MLVKRLIKSNDDLIVDDSLTLPSFLDTSATPASYYTMQIFRNGSYRAVDLSSGLDRRSRVRSLSFYLTYDQAIEAELFFLRYEGEYLLFDDTIGLVLSFERRSEYSDFIFDLEIKLCDPPS